MGEKCPPFRAQKVLIMANNQELGELAARCERAVFPCETEAEADELVSIKAAICRLLFGRGYDAYSLDYTASLDAAMTLKPKGWLLDYIQEHEERYTTAGLYTRKGTIPAERATAWAPTAALALCAAALKAHARGDHP